MRLSDLHATTILEAYRQCPLSTPRRRWQPVGKRPIAGIRIWIASLEPAPNPLGAGTEHPFHHRSYVATARGARLWQKRSIGEYWAPGQRAVRCNGTSPHHYGSADMVSALKGLGYLISTLSVVLLGIVAWKGAKEELLLFAFLIAGMAASVAGMGLRWLSHRLSEKEKQTIRAVADAAAEQVAPPAITPIRGRS
jgi:hypothetical protein